MKGIAMEIKIRNMIEQDIDDFSRCFEEQGWEKPRELLERYYKEQDQGFRQVFVAEADGQAAGYALLLPNDPNHGPFKDKGIPTVRDFNVFEKFQRHGIGSAILDRVEETAAGMSDAVCLGVGLHSGYGSAQRMYVKRGYVPDGSGVWYRGEVLGQYEDCCNDDDLILYLKKDFPLSGNGNHPKE